jgi:transketolase
MRNTFIRELIKIAEKDKNIYLLTGDLGFSVLEPFLEKLPDQFVNVGVAEQNLTGVATGLALTGKIVFTYSIANFPTLRCLEQIRNDACYHNANVKIISIGSGFSYGTLGYTHYGVEDISIMRALPKIKIISPADPIEPI